MLDKYKGYMEDPNTLPKEYINDGLLFIKDFCESNNYDVNEYVCNKDNIPEITNAIHKKVPFLMRAIVSKNLISEMLTKHQGWIVEQVNELSSTNEKQNKPKM